MSSDYYDYQYVSAADRELTAKRALKKLEKSGRVLHPVTSSAKAIATTWWGRSWCRHLESYSDMETRLPRGRTYLRRGAVLDLQVTPGRIEALVIGAELYEQGIAVKPLAPERWAAIKAACAGQIDSVIDLLQGKLSEPVMKIIADRDTGLFPAPRELGKVCNCLDSADLCKHLAAVLYGFAVRLDTQPELLFTLRGVDHLELVEGLDAGALASSAGEGGAMGEAELADVFGIEIEPAPAKAIATQVAPAKKARKSKASESEKKTARRDPGSRLPK